MYDLQQLLGELALTDDLVEVVGALLRFCRDHEAEVRLADDDAGRALVGMRLRRDATSLFRGITRRFPSRADLDRLSSLLRDGSDTCGLGLASREVAGAFDDVLGPRVFDWFRAGPGRIVLREGMPFPVVQHPVKKIFGDTLNSRPERQSPYASPLSSIRIAPNLGPFEVVLSFEHADLIRALQRGDKIGVGFPLAQVADHDYDLCGSTEMPRFFNVRPRDAVAQAAILTRVLEEAESLGLSLLVLPELCVDAAGQEIVGNWFRSLGRSLHLVGAGTRHLVDNGVRRNRATVLVKGAPPLAHDKFSPFVWHQEGKDLREDIATVPSRIVVHYSEGWSVVVLVCKDLLDERVGPLLAQLRTRLILVPAFSERTGPFRARLEELACAAQAVVVVANTPASESCDAMLVALPVERSSVRTASAPVTPGTVKWVELNPAGEMDDK